MPAKSILALLTTFALAPAQSELSRSAEDGAPLANRWYTRGGCASRTAATPTRPIATGFVTAWTQDLEGELEGEPLVWDDRVVVVEQKKPNERCVHVHRLADGKRLYSSIVFRTTAPLAPALFRRSLVLRHTPKGLVAYDLLSGELGQRWLLHFDGEVHEPLLFEGEVYAATQRELVRIELLRKKVEWRAPGSFLGPITLRGDVVYTLESRADEELLVAHRRRDGESIAEREIGYLIPEAPPREGIIQVGEEALVLRLPRSARIRTSGGVVPGYGLRLALDHESLLSAADVSALDLVSDAATAGRALLVHDAKSAIGDAWMLELGKQSANGEPATRVVPLAAKNAHAELVKSQLAPTIAQEIAYIGGRVVDLGTLELLGKLPIDSFRRVVPARDTLLVAGTKKLTALRERADEPASASLGPASRPGAARLPGALAVLRDGTILEGDLECDGAALVPTSADKNDKRPKPRIAIEDVQLLLGKDRAVLHCAGAEAARTALERLEELDYRQHHLEAAAAAAKGGDLVALGWYLMAARNQGATDKQLEALERKLDELEKKAAAPPAKGKPGAKPAQPPGPALDFRKGLQELVAKVQSRTHDLVARVAGLLPLQQRIALLALAVDRDQYHPAVAGEVKALLPREVEAPQPFEAREWLEFVKAYHEVSTTPGRIPLRIVKPPRAGEAADPEFAFEKTVLAKHTGQGGTPLWRTDLVGVRSKHLLIVTPLEAPGRIARCLSTGELVCETLEKTFGGLRQPDRPAPLVILLYTSKKEYVRESKRAGTGAHIAWTDGHYSFVEGLSRMFLPADAREFDKVLRVFSHELTHHWLDSQCPAFSEAERQTGQAAVLTGKHPGYWIVEGFASFLEGFAFDVVTRSASPAGGRPVWLEHVSGIDEKSLIEWGKVYGSTVAEAKSFDPRPQYPVARHWSLGSAWNLSLANLFYAQSAATCAYLFEAEDSKLRRALLTYLADFYAGRADKLDVEKAFGLKAEELGKRVRAFALERVGR